ATEVPWPMDGPVRESSGTTKVTCAADHQATIRLEKMIYQTVTSRAITRKLRSHHHAVGRLRSPYPACALIQT
ncbi:hypothetical protein, partial [Roseiconus lacunae]|uniref:hypothetical protein n=1 Tax=Roseiconus lacunae TaxID=2605694 RepID=UPI0019401950